MSAIAFIVLCGLLAWRGYRLAGKVVALQDQLQQSLGQSEALVRRCEQSRQQANANQAAWSSEWKTRCEVQKRNADLCRELRELRAVRRALARSKANPFFTDNTGGVS